MTAATSPPWLDRLYGGAMIVHVVIAVLILGVALAAAWPGGGADSAPDFGAGSLLLRLVLFATTLLGAIIPVIAILSWWLLRRRGVRPSPGHKGLAVAGTLPYLGLFGASVMQWL